MRVGLVSPYSWSHPGGVTRHVEALAEELLARGHEVQVFSPVDGPHDDLPSWLVPLGGTIGAPFNGAVTRMALHPAGVSTLRRELRAFAPEVVHLHEPVVPTACWDTLMTSPAPLVGTFHTYGTNAVTHGFAALGGSRRRMRRLAVRVAVSEAAAWTGRRFYGGEYRVIPNGVHLHEHDAQLGPGSRTAPFRVAFVGAAVARKGLPVLLRAFDALREVVPDAELTVVGAEVPLVDGVRGLGRVDEAAKLAVLREADVLAAPSLGGESFGMVLTEAFAAGTPVAASDIPGYREVVGDGGVLVPAGDAQALAEALRDLALDPDLRHRLADTARRRADAYGWPRVADAVEEAYEDAIAVGPPRAAAARPVPRARRLPPIEPAPRTGVRGLAAILAALAVAAAAVWALQRIGPEAVLSALVSSSPAWVLLALALMVASMGLRAVAWHALLRAAVPGARLRDALQGTAIGVLMSATLPARLGEPARALIVARRLGRPRERLPVVVGTLVSQTLLNVLALVLLGIAVVPHVAVFAGGGSALAWYAAVPVALGMAVLVLPALLRPALRRHAARLRAGLVAFRSPGLGATAMAAQLGAWAVQWVACYLLLVALGLEGRAGIGAAAAVLFAVNVTAVLPVVPSNLGVFQAACVAVLAGAYDVRAGEALAYGIVLQAVEVATAFAMGVPALLREGLSWREVRLRTLHAAPVRLGPRRPSPAGSQA